MEAAKRQHGVARPCGRGTVHERQDARASGGCFRADSVSTALRLCVEKVAMCPWPVVACPCDSEGPTWCNLLVSARATRRYVVHGVNIVLANVWFLVRQLHFDPEGVQ